MTALLALALAAAAARATITVIGLADYHAHAIPFRSEGRADQGGIARTVAFLRAARAAGPTLVLSGGDTLNADVPTWSDEYRCREWPWLDGLVDAMALGNHEADYGWDELTRCRGTARYPVMAANLVGADGALLLPGPEGKPYLVREVGGIRIGAFAVAGPDFARLVKAENLPPGARFTDPVAAAREAVRALRETEHVSAVILFGHEHTADDVALARAVPGIDLVLGTHSHVKQDLLRIPGTDTWMVSPFQYLAYLSRVELRFEGARLAGVSGGLVAVDAALGTDGPLEATVRQLQQDLEARRPERFQVIGRTALELSEKDGYSGETLLGNWATEVLRQASQTHAFLATASGFRAALPPGPVTAEDFRSAIPYPNRLTVATLTGAQVQALVVLCVGKAGTDGFSQQSGLRYALEGGTPRDLQILQDPARPERGFAPVDPAATYRIGTTDFQAYVAGGYRELFAQAASLHKTDADAHAALRAALAAGEARATLDGRSGGASR